MTIQEMVDAINSRENCSFSFFCKLEELTDQNNTNEAVKCIKDHFDCDEEIANQVFNEYKKQIYAECKRIENESRSSLTPEQIAHNNAVAKEWQNKPKCPTCSSTNVQKIGTGERMASVAVLGIFSKKINKSFKCKSCGYTW